MKIAAFIAVAALLLAGCATSHPTAEWVSKNKPLAEQGVITWSSYYEQLYDLSAQANHPNKAAYMHRLNRMISVAKAYERKEITEDQFQFERRRAQAEQTADNEAQENARRRAALSAVEKMNQANARANSEPLYQIVPPVPLQRSTHTNCMAFGNQVNCTTH